MFSSRVHIHHFAVFSASQTPYIATCSLDGKAKLFDLKDVFLCQDSTSSFQRADHEIVDIIPGTRIFAVLTLNTQYATYLVF